MTFEKYLEENIFVNYMKKMKNQNDKNELNIAIQNIYKNASNSNVNVNIINQIQNKNIQGQINQQPQVLICFLYHLPSSELQH